MILNFEHGFAFVHVPKTGGSTITAELTLGVGGKIPELAPGWQAQFHLDGMHSGYSTRGAAAALWSFGFVRNPFDLWVSRYFARPEGKGGKVSFDEFVRRGAGNKLWSTPMVDMLTCPNTHKKVSFVGRFERYAADVEIAFRHIGLPLNVDRLLHVNKGDHPRWEDVHTKATLQLVRQIHARDFDAFDYER